MNTELASSTTVQKAIELELKESDLLAHLEDFLIYVGERIEPGLIDSVDWEKSDKGKVRLEYYKKHLLTRLERKLYS